MSWRVIVGTLSLVVTMILLGYVAVTEQDRMAGFATAYQARQIEAGAILFESNCSPCHGLDGKGTGRAPALNTPDLLTNGKRLTEIGWSGTVHDYILATVSGGRPRPSVQFSQYPQRMPTWSQDYGGPLRDDQIQNIVAFILNWGPALANVTPEPTQAIVAVGTDITQKLPTGDPASGQQLVQTLGCPACHISQGGASTLGPNWQPAGENNNQGIGTRAPLRIKAADYKGQATSGDQYIFESIVSPNAYIVPGNATYAPGGQSLMAPLNFSTKMSAQNVADVIAYRDTIK
jgi:mono/diheme cytochrome c family protein